MKQKHYDWALLILRVVIGIVFLRAGWLKWQDMPSTINFFAGLGFASFWAYLVSTIELLGGLALIVGVFTKWSGWLLAAIMLVAIYSFTGQNGFDSYSFNLVLLAASAALALLPPGHYAVKLRPQN